MEFLKVKMDSTPSKTFETPQICKFDNNNMFFKKNLLDSFQIVEGKTIFSRPNHHIFKLDR